MKNTHFTVRLNEYDAKKFNELLDEHLKSGSCYYRKTRNSLVAELIEKAYKGLKSKEKV